MVDSEDIADKCTDRTDIDNTGSCLDNDDIADNCLTDTISPTNVVTR